MFIKHTDFTYHLIYSLHKHIIITRQLIRFNLFNIIRYNIFQLYQTYRGDDPRLNIGPKGFTGEDLRTMARYALDAAFLPEAEKREIAGKF